MVASLDGHGIRHMPRDSSSEVNRPARRCWAVTTNSTVVARSGKSRGDDDGVVGVAREDVLAELLHPTRTPRPRMPARRTRAPTRGQRGGPNWPNQPQQPCWPRALRAIRSWLTPAVTLYRWWRAWTDKDPPSELQALIDAVTSGPQTSGRPTSSRAICCGRPGPARLA